MKTGWFLATAVAVLSCTSSDGPSNGAKVPSASEPAATAPTTAQPKAETPPAKVERPADAEPTDTEPAAKAVSPAPKPTKAGQNFAAEVKLLYQLAACGSDTAPEGVRPHFHKNHCASLEKAVSRYRTRWLEVASPELAKMVPADLPTTIVYPFGGGDLLTALATFPQATEITTLSLELAGDVNTLQGLSRGKLEQVVTQTRTFARFLLQVVHSKTSNMRQIMRSTLPAQLVFGLIAMKVHDLEPISLRYFKLTPEGKVEYYGKAELDAARASKKKRETAAVFANAEIEFRRKDGQGGVRTWRHFGANLDNKHLEEDPALLRHLKAKGKIAAMTKAASYLLWWDNFSTVRNYLLEHAVWMISDSTGIMPDHAAAAGFEQITYGAFDAPFLNAGTAGTRQFRKLWRGQERRRLRFRYGYPDGSAKKHSHLIIMRKRR